MIKNDGYACEDAYVDIEIKMRRQYNLRGGHVRPNESHETSEQTRLTSRERDQMAAPLTVSPNLLTHSTISFPSQR